VALRLTLSGELPFSGFLELGHSRHQVVDVHDGGFEGELSDSRARQTKQ
jgi:hypothetical protein